jgi:hypothetical protein
MLLVIGHWSLVISHWSLVIGHWSLVIGHWSLVIGHWSLVIGHWSLVIGHWSLVWEEFLPKKGTLNREQIRNTHLHQFKAQSKKRCFYKMRSPKKNSTSTPLSDRVIISISCF